MSTGNLPRLEECTCLAVRQAARHITQFYDQHLAPVGLRTTQFSILARLRRQGPMTINALADELVMDRTTLGRNILPLEREGLISVAPGRTDRRSKELRLTGAGVERLQGGARGLEGGADASSRPPSAKSAPPGCALARARFRRPICRLRPPRKAEAGSARRSPDTAQAEFVATNRRIYAHVSSDQSQENIGGSHERYRCRTHHPGRVKRDVHQAAAQMDAVRGPRRTPGARRRALRL